MKNRGKQFLEKIEYKVDLLLWFLSIPLLPIILTGFFVPLAPDTQKYFVSYYFSLWIVFTGEFILRLVLSEKRIEYLRKNWIDLFVVVTPAFRVFKVFRFVRFPMMVLSERVLRAFGSLGMNVVYYLVFVIVVMLVGADLLLFFEQNHASPNIKTFGDAAWWAIAYLTTTGSAVQVMTTGGRAVGVVLMTIGFAVFSVLIASIVSFFMKEHAQTMSRENNMLEGIKEQLGIGDIADRLERIEKKLNES